MPFPSTVLREIDRPEDQRHRLRRFEVSTECVVHDEDGNHVLGICEYDPGVPNTAMVSRVAGRRKCSARLLALSTLGHELGHAVFDAPGWIVDGSKGPRVVR
jgi:hypothetical protein